MKVLFFVVLTLVAVACGQDEKKEEADSVAPATLATPTALFKCGEVRIKALRNWKISVKVLMKRLWKLTIKTKRL